MSGNPPGNVISPQFGQWGPPAPFPPGAVPPGCFNELARLNQCYNEVQMMEMILSKVITDLVTNNKAVQDAIVAAIVASGSNVPLIGITNGSDAQPGQVGEYLTNSQNVPMTVDTTNVQTVIIQSLLLTPGDWDVWALASPLVGPVTGLGYELSPVPTGLYTSLAGALWAQGAGDASIVVSAMGRANVTIPTLLVFAFNYLGSSVAQNAYFQCNARRRR